ncbi:MAG: helix-turn-helix transcriptional regulator [Owenweeksia sp.]|nr:helix-turn-helix transcriptional regulator [Owenweeksia sp.]
MNNTVKKHRLLAEMTQSDLAAAIGVSRQTIHAIETGKYVPSTVLALRLAAHFGVSVEKLFQLDET